MTQKQLTNGIKHTLGLTQAHMEQALNGDRLMTAQKGTNPVDSVCGKYKIF